MQAGVVLAVVLLVTSVAPQCAVPQAEAARQLTLRYEQFDGENGSHGWRQLNEKGCVDAVLRLLQDYSTANTRRLTQAQRSEIAFHQGQVLGFNGRDREALPHFEEALRIGGDDEWTTYIRATVAFLRRDMNELHRHRQHYATLAPDSMRLRVLDGFLKCSGDSYMQAMHCGM